MEFTDAERNFAEVVAMRIVTAADELLAQLNRDPDVLVYGKPVADLTELIVKASFALENLYFASGEEPGPPYRELAKRYNGLLAALNRVASSFVPLSEPI